MKDDNKWDYDIEQYEYEKEKDKNINLYILNNLIEQLNEAEALLKEIDLDRYFLNEVIMKVNEGTYKNISYDYQNGIIVGVVVELLDNTMNYIDLRKFKPLLRELQPLTIGMSELDLYNYNKVERGVLIK